MKWIGQHIWDFISRFRSDVYIDDDATLNVKTIKSETTINLTLPDESYVNFLNRSQYFGHIGSDIGTKQTVFTLYESITSPQDSFNLLVFEHGNTKITTNDVEGAAAHFEIEADGNITLDAEGHVYIEADSSLFVGGYQALNEYGFVMRNNQQYIETMTGLRNIGEAGEDANFLSDTLLMQNATTEKPNITLRNITNDATGGNIDFENRRYNSGWSAGLDNDVLGNISFKALNDGTPTITTFSKIYGDIADATTGQEAGRLSFQVAEYDGTLTTGLKLDGDTNADGEVDVTIGAGAASATTVAGDLTVSGGDITLSGTGRIQGVDTVSASTDAANKGYVDGKYMYSYIQIHGRTANDNTVWNFPDASNDGEFNWEGSTSYDAWDGGDSGVNNNGDNTTAGTTVISLGRDIGVMGIVLPYDCTLIGFTGIGRDLSGNNPFKAGLWTSEEFSTYGGNASNTNYTLRAVATASYSGGGGSNYNGICRLEDLTANHTLRAGQILLPSLSESTSSRSYVSMTIVLKVPIITV